MGRSFLLATAAMVLGTLLGAFQPRGELLALRAELLEVQARTRDCQRGAAGAGLREFFRAPARVADSEEDAAEGAAPRGKDTAEAEAPPTEAEEEEGGTNEPEAASEGPDEVAAMVAAMDARSAQARAALLEQADLDDEEIEAIDTAIDRMNARLKQQVDAFAQSVEAGGEPDRRELMDFAAEALDAVIEADDALVATIPESVREGMDDEALDPMSFISGDTLSAIATLEGR